MAVAPLGTLLIAGIHRQGEKVVACGDGGFNAGFHENILSNQEYRFQTIFVTLKACNEIVTMAIHLFSSSGISKGLLIRTSIFFPLVRTSKVGRDDLLLMTPITLPITGG